MLACKPGEFGGVRRGARVLAAHQFKHHRLKSLQRTRADMREARSPRLSASDEGDRTIDLAQRPQSEREHPHRRDAGVVSEPERQIVVAPGLEQGERAFLMLSGFGVLSGTPMSASRYSVRDAGLGRIGSRLDVA
jgi:hypothetical protein